MKIKPNVRIDHTSFRRPQVARILWIAQETAPPNYEVTITCGTESHKPWTHHAKGEAFDIRTRDYQYDVHEWAKTMQDQLGSEYYVVVEPNDTCPNAVPHIHVQYNGV